jgi:hypothetical protein
MLSENIYSVLKTLTDRFSGNDINWVLVGSVSLALQGMDIKPNDIDILTDRSGALAMDDLLKDFVKKRVLLRESHNFKSYFGTFAINSVGVEIMGDLQIKNPDANPWVETDNLSKKIFVQYKDLKIPCFGLEHEYLAYSRMGREEKADKIKRFLEKAGSN